jgi:hypothetical protein
VNFLDGHRRNVRKEDSSVIDVIKLLFVVIVNRLVSSSSIEILVSSLSFKIVVLSSLFIELLSSMSGSCITKPVRIRLKM